MDCLHTVIHPIPSSWQRYDNRLWVQCDLCGLNFIEAIDGVLVDSRYFNVYEQNARWRLHVERHLKLTQEVGDDQ